MKTHIAFALAVAMLVLSLPSCKRNSPPDVPPAPVGPAACAKDTAYTFRATGVDPDGDSIALRIDWGDGNQSAWSSFVASGETATFGYIWDSLGVWSVRAQAKDPKELHSDWSQACSVTLTRTPSVPAAPFGPTYARKDSILVYGAHAVDPDGDSVAIRFLWAETDTSDWSSLVGSGETVWLSHVWTQPDTYAVRAQARDRLGVLSNWSNILGVVVRHDTLGKWRLRLASGTAEHVTSSPAIGQDGTVYIGAPDGSLYAVNPDGTVRWRYQTGTAVYSSPAVAADGTIYIGGDAYLYAVNADGTLKWRYLTSGWVSSSPAIGADGAVYFGGGEGLYALNADGTLRWLYETVGLSTSPVVAADGTIYFGARDDYVTALNPDGSHKWRYDMDGDVLSAPAIGSDGTVYVPGGRWSFVALNPDSTLKWDAGMSGSRDYSASPALAADGTIYLFEAALRAINPDGSQKWYLAGSWNLASSPAVAADGAVYCGTWSRSFICVNPDGTLRWRYEVGAEVESSAAIGPDGTIYFGADDGYLYALKGTQPLADSPWPKFHHDLRNSGRVGGP